MRWLIDFLESSIGRKWLVALTGIGWVLYLILHMVGNLQIFAGPDAINGWAANLRTMPGVLWTVRGLLVVGIVLHVFMAIRSTMKNRAARPTKYVKRRYLRSSPAARTMIYSGLIIFAFICYHLAQFTLHWTNPEYGHMHDILGRHDVYSMVVMGFSNYGIVALYIIAVALVCMHLTHGVPSFFQTLGLRHPKYTPLLNFLGIGLALVLFVGFTSVPVSVMAHWIKPLGGM